MANPDLAEMALEASFETHGRDATYTAPGSDVAVPCLVMAGRADVTVGGLTAGRPFMAGGILLVRKGEIAAPVRDGVFAIEGGATLVVASDPKTDDDERLVWTMTVR